MFNRSALACLSLIGLSALGCSKETTSSANIKTGGIAALIDVYANTGTTATVHVKLVVGGSDSNTFVDLEGGDELSATVDGGEPKVLKAIDTGIYEATFSDVGEDSEFSVTLERPDDETASGNSGSLPPPFTLDEPADQLSRKNDALEVTWDPVSDDEMNLEIHGDCIYTFNRDVSDTGSYTVGADKLDSTGGDMPETCDLDLDAVRTRQGSADSKFDPESWFRLHQQRQVTFVSKP
jgi:hypothetical protein